VIPNPFIFEQTGADPLVEGYYLIDLSRARRVSIPVRIWFGLPLDPETGIELDRSPRWQVQVGFQLLLDEPVKVGPIQIHHLTDVWPTCAKNPIDEVDWRYRLERAEWAADYDSTDPYSNLGGRIDPMTCALP
jgi:hypothetical protein